MGSGLASEEDDRSGDEGACEGGPCELKNDCSDVEASCMVEEIKSVIEVPQVEAVVISGWDGDFALD